MTIQFHHELVTELLGMKYKAPQTFTASSCFCIQTSSCSGQRLLCPALPEPFPSNITVNRTFHLSFKSSWGSHARNKNARVMTLVVTRTLRTGLHSSLRTERSDAMTWSWVVFSPVQVAPRRPFLCDFPNRAEFHAFGFVDRARRSPVVS